ncbi:hypothetical protein ANCCAN_29073 [Ancylostoma caninum]|uniref:Uncharacterized protein n=1 Tax=Ancylostoma caninum TaxID=29170 RepID=A0A368EZJ5_ANCCA|nr:hypothetical protein ANCCAN_29073 [Ancylostoma caninum]
MNSLDFSYSKNASIFHQVKDLQQNRPVSIWLTTTSTRSSRIFKLAIAIRRHASTSAPATPSPRSRPDRHIQGRRELIASRARESSTFPVDLSISR